MSRTSKGIEGIEMFLDANQLQQLTGRKAKSLQIEWLRQQGIPFRINATGHPVVTCATVEGKREQPAPAKGWTPKVVTA
jgi:hypothetical protein